MREYLSFIFLICLSFTSAAQIRVLSGTNVQIGAGTTVQMSSAAADTLKIDSGAAVINNGVIALSPSSVISEAAGSPVSGSGYETHTSEYSSPMSGQNPGGLGLTISTALAPDSLTVTRRHSILSKEGTPGIARNYQVSAENNSGLGASVTFHYDSTEQNSHPVNMLTLYQSMDGGTTWSSFPGSSSSYFVQSQTGVFDALHLLSLFPFDLKIDSINTLSFYHGDSIHIHYTQDGTLNPGNKLVFEFSDATGSFGSPLVLDSIPDTGSGTLSRVIPSTFPAGNQYRIRIRTTDFPVLSADNGNDITIMDPLVTSVNDTPEDRLLVYPNPASSVIFIDGKNILSVSLYDELGRLLRWVQATGSRSVIDVSQLKPAVYTVEIRTASGIIRKRFVRS